VEVVQVQIPMFYNTADAWRISSCQLLVQLAIK